MLIGTITFVTWMGSGAAMYLLYRSVRHDISKKRKGAK